MLTREDAADRQRPFVPQCGRVPTPFRNILIGLVVAVAIALLLIPSIGGVASWKILLALVGLSLWFLAEKRR